MILPRAAFLCVLTASTVSTVLTALAEIEAQCGRPDDALAHRTAALGIPSPVSPGLLRADPIWAPLRGDPRFQRLAAGN